MMIKIKSGGIESLRFYVYHLLRYCVKMCVNVCEIMENGASACIILSWFRGEMRMSQFSRLILLSLKMYVEEFVVV